MDGLFIEDHGNLVAGTLAAALQLWIAGVNKGATLVPLLPGDDGIEIDETLLTALNEILTELLG